MKKDVILFIGNYNRTDYLTLLQKCLPHISFIFLYFSSSKEETNNFYNSYGRAVYFKDYDDAETLLTKEKPVKVIFLEIDTYNQVVLNVICKNRGIKTHLLDHGVRNVNFSNVFAKTQQTQNLLTKIKNKLYAKINLLDRLRTRLFFLNSLEKLEKPQQTYLKRYYKVRSKNSIFITRKLIPSSYLRPDIYLSFSAFVYEAHKAYDTPDEDQKVRFIGIPYLDELVKTTPLATSKSKVLFVDQAFVTQGILGWTPALKLQLNMQLIAFCELNKLELIVKEHPLEKSSMWHQIISTNLIIDNTSPIEVLAAETQIAIGFYSTLLLGLAALPHFTLFTFEGHPAGDFALSDFLVKRGVSKPFNTIQELAAFFGDLPAEHAHQVAHKQRFIEECLYRFDGRSGERLKEFLLE